MAMENFRRGSPLADGSVVEVPLILLRDVVLFPGETLPLRLYNPNYIRCGPLWWIKVDAAVMDGTCLRPAGCSR
jgi:hypothetical protein